jgi:MFS family permease
VLMADNKALSGGCTEQVWDAQDSAGENIGEGDGLGRPWTGTAMDQRQCVMVPSTGRSQLVFDARPVTTAARPAASGRASVQESSGRWRALTLLAVTLLLGMSTWFSASVVISSLDNLADIVPPRHVILGGAIGAAVVNALLTVAGGPGVGIPLRLATGFFLAGVYPPAFKLMATWFRKGRGLALGLLAAAIVVGNGMPLLVNGLGGQDWRVVIYATSALTLAGGVMTEFAVKEGPFPFPRATFNPRQAGRVFANRGVRLASLGYIGHMWELFAMSAWFSAFFADALALRGASGGSTAAYATFAMFVAGGWAAGQAVSWRIASAGPRRPC